MSTLIADGATTAAVKDISEAAYVYNLDKWANLLALSRACVWSLVCVLGQQYPHHQVSFEKDMGSVLMKMMFAWLDVATVCFIYHFVWIASACSRPVKEMIFWRMLLTSFQMWYFAVLVGAWLHSSIMRWKSGRVLRRWWRGWHVKYRRLCSFSSTTFTDVYILFQNEPNQPLYSSIFGRWYDYYDGTNGDNSSI